MRKTNKMINAGLGYTIGNVLIKGISFFTIPLYTRLMVTADYGIYNTYTAYVSIVTFVISLGLDPTLKNAEYDYKEHKQTYLSTVYLTTLIPFVVLLACAILFGNSISKFFELNQFVLILLIVQSEASAIINIYNIKLSLSYSSKSYLEIAFFDTICGIALSVCLMLTAFNGVRYLGRIVGSLVPIMIVATTIIVKNIVLSKEERYNIEMARYGLVLGLPLIPHLISQIINSQFDRIMISKIVGYAESGIYSFTYNIAVILQIIYTSLDSVWSPWFFSRMADRDYAAIWATSQKYIMVMTFLTAGLMTISREFIMLFATQSYWDGIGMSQTLIIGIFFLYLYTLPVGVEYYTKNTKYIAMGSILTAVLNIVLNYFAINRFGYQAAAVTTLISYCFLFLIHWFIYLRVRPAKLYDLKRILISAGGIFLWGVCCRMLENFWIIRYAVFLIFALCVLYFFKQDVADYLFNCGFVQRVRK